MPLKPILCLLLAGFNSLLLAAPGETPRNATANALVTVNGETVSRELYTAYFQSKRQSQPAAAAEDDAQQLAILNELVNFLLLAQDAEAKGLDQRPQIAAELDLARSRLLANTAIRERLNAQPIPEAALRKAYDEKFKGKAVNEYKLSHILLESEQAAEPIVAALESGQSFAELARRHSLDSSADSGGELGWLSLGQMNPALKAGLATMVAGEYSKQPVKSEFGWHLLLLEQVRSIAQPGYGEMRASLLQSKQRKLLTDYIKELRAKAEVELKIPASGGAGEQEASPQAPVE